MFLSTLRGEDAAPAQGYITPGSLHFILGQYVKADCSVSELPSLARELSPQIARQIIACSIQKPVNGVPCPPGASNKLYAQYQKEILIYVQKLSKCGKFKLHDMAPGAATKPPAAAGP